MDHIGILGTGMVGQALARRLAGLGHAVTVGARSAESPSLEPFAEIDGVATGSFADAAHTSALIVNATNGNHSVEAVASCAAVDLAGKTLIDVANCLDHSRGMASAALAAPDHCLAEEIQAVAPEADVVKALNTMNCEVMVEPSLVSGDHVAFLSGDSETAKSQVRSLLREFGWRDTQLIDLGGLETASGPEMAMQLWLDVMVARGGFDAGPFNFAIAS